MREIELKHFHELSPDIISILNKTRKWAEKYNTVVRKIPDTIGLSGMCAIASTKIKLLLNNKNIDSKICVGEAHCFVKHGRYILDVTASQFGYPNIFCIKTHTRDYRDFITEYPKYTCYKHWRIVRKFDKVDEFLEYQFRVNWPETQIYNYSSDRKLK